MLLRAFDLSALHDLAERLAGLGSPALLRALNERLAAAALAQVRREFEEGRDPLGQPWAALRRRAGRPLVRTGRLAASFGSRATGRGFAIGTPLAFAGFHQDGTAALPARPMLPGSQLGPGWTQALEDEVEAAVGRLFGSAG